MSAKNRPDAKAARRAEREGRRTTHEPPPGPHWPYGNVSVELTGPEEDECIEVVIHGVRHLLHSSTAAALTWMLLDRLRKWDATAGTSLAVMPMVEGNPSAWRKRGVTDVEHELRERH